MESASSEEQGLSSAAANAVAVQLQVTGNLYRLAPRTCQLELTDKILSIISCLIPRSPYL